MLLPLVCHKADQLIHDGIALLGLHLLDAVQLHQRQRGAAVGVGPVIQAGAELRLKIAAVEHARQKVVVHVVAAHLPLARGHPVLRQVVARQRRGHLQFPYLAVRNDLAAQYAVYLPIAQLVVHHQAVILPAAGCFFVRFGQGHVLKGGLCAAHKFAQVLLGPFFLHAFFPIIVVPDSPSQHTLPRKTL